MRWTDREISQLWLLHRVCSRKMISALLGRTINFVEKKIKCQNYAREYSSQNVYVLYKGDRWITDGTIAEIAAFRGAKRATTEWLSTPVASKRKHLKLSVMKLGKKDNFS